jgi:phage gpG-like protein
MDAIDTLDNLSRAISRPEKLAKIGGMAADIIRGRIHRGRGFSPLSPATAAYRGAGRPLQDTGALRDSITFKVIDERTVSVGTNKPYAAIQNSGGVIRAKKNWLWIPAAGTRQLQRRYGYSPTDVLKGLRAAGYSVFRKGRTMCRRGKRRTRGGDGGLRFNDHTLYYLKKSVEIPARPFFYLTEPETALLAKEAGVALEQL